MSNESNLSLKQQEILAFLKREIREKGFPPSLREIGSAVGLRSTASVHSNLNKLEEYGFIRRDPDKQRAIEILDDQFRQGLSRPEGVSPEEVVPDSEFAMVPVIGNVAAGVPILAVEQIESYIPVPVDRLPNQETFILSVRGESMINAGILDGDYVLVEKTASVSNGEMAVALVEDSATVKTFYRENGYVRLQPENDYMDPILVYGDLEILGRVIGVMRFFR